MRKLLCLFVLPLILAAQTPQTIEIGTFNAEWFPCKDNGQMMKKYGINLRYPPTGDSTDIEAMFSMLKALDIELLGVEEIVDPDLFAASAKKYLGEEYKFIYAPSGGQQKVGFLYDSSVLKLVGQPEEYGSVELRPDSRLRPAFRGYFKTIPDGFDFHAVVVHLKASPRGWDQRQKQWQALKDILEDLPKKSKDADIILMGDMNDVTDKRENEFKPLLDSLGFYWITGELNGKPTDYWQPDYKENRIQGSDIDHIMVSSDAKIEYEPKSVQVGGACSAAIESYEGEKIPAYFKSISDHCPVFATFYVNKDDD